MSAKRGPGRRRKSKGLLMRIRDAPSKSRQREVSAGRKAVEWAGGIAIAVVILGAVVLLGVRFFAPNLGNEVRERVTRIDDILAEEDSPLGRPVPVVLIDEIPTWLRAEPTRAVDPEIGMWVRVTYRWSPATGSVRVLDWEPTDAPPDAPPEADDGAEPGS